MHESERLHHIQINDRINYGERVLHFFKLTYFNWKTTSVMSQCIYKQLGEISLLWDTLTTGLALPPHHASEKFKYHLVSKVVDDESPV